MILDKFEFSSDECWYNSVCSLFSTDKCCQSCVRYMQMYYLFNLGDIPKPLQYPKRLVPNEEDLSSFEDLQAIKEDIVNFVNNGENLYIYSKNCGNGKTTWAVKLLAKYFDEIWAGNGFTCRGVFVRVGKLLNRLKKSIGDKDTALPEYIRTLKKCDLVVWDDIGEYKLSVFEQQSILEIIDDRLYANKANIYTSNVIDNLLLDNVGPRLHSRILNSSIQIEFIGDDRRIENGSITDTK